MDRVSSIIFQKEELKKDALLLLHSSFALCGLVRSFQRRKVVLLLLNNLCVLHYRVRVSSSKRRRRRRQREILFFCRREEGKAAANFLSSAFNHSPENLTQKEAREEE